MSSLTRSRLNSGLLLLVLSATSLVFASTPSPASAASGFEDTRGHIFAQEIDWLAASGITKGCNPPANTRFCPDEYVTRGQMAAFLVRALNLPSASVSFTDMRGHVFEGDVAAFAAAGVTRGCNPPANDRFCPDEPVTRGQMAAFLKRALGLPASFVAFTDTVGHIFESDVSSLADAGITRGCNPPANDRFCPDEPVTRGQMAAFLYRAFSGEGDASAPANLVVSTAALPQAQVGASYSAKLAASGATPPYSWSVSGLPKGLMFDPGSGQVSGIPAPGSHGTYTLTVSVTDAVGATASRKLKLVVAPVPLKVDTSSLPGAKVGASYSVTLAASGGVKPYRWSASGLPSGLSINASTGRISGVPATGSHGSKKVTVTLQDAAGAKVSKALTLAVSPKDLSVATSALPSAKVGKSYSVQLSASGGVGPYLWSAAGLPAGLDINVFTGRISGVPEVGFHGDFLVTVTVTDSRNVTSNKTFSLSVSAADLMVTSSGFVAREGEFFSESLEAAGGVLPYTWELVSGSLPTGLELEDVRWIVGTPAAGSARPEPYMLTVRVTDALGAEATRTVTLRVLPEELRVGTLFLPSAKVGEAYETTLVAQGGVGGYVWSLASGSQLPTGLILGSDGTISGTPHPSSVGAWDVTFVVEDADGSHAHGTLTLEVEPDLEFDTLFLPDAKVGEPYTHTLTVTGGQAPYVWELTGGALPEGLGFDPDTHTISGTPGEGSHGWHEFEVTVTDDFGVSVTSEFLLYVDPSDLKVVTAALPPASSADDYFVQLEASGGVGEYVWGYSGWLPLGLSFDPTDGVISGRPNADEKGYHLLTVTVYSGDDSESVDLWLAVDPDPLAIDDLPADNLFSFEEGESVLIQFQASGGAGGYLWGLEGDLPSGLTWDGLAGTISGVADAGTAGTYELVLTVYDQAGNETSEEITLDVSDV